jgi:serine/threonine-protein kinase
LAGVSGPSHQHPAFQVDGDTLVLAGITEGTYFADRYRIGGVLGTGAMGKVFRATDLRMERQVALKVLHPDKARKEQVLARFRREAEIMMEARHPGIVEVLDSGRTPEGIDYIVMEVLDGRTLREHLRERGAMSPKELVPIVVGVADALAAAHAKGVVHRDLKPDNVFLCYGGLVKVVDFGLSMLDIDKRMTKTGVMLGTPRYMAPEQIRSAKDVDPRVDVYALGVMAHESLTNASPFPASDAAQLLGCVIEGRVVRLEDQRPDLPPGLGEVVRRAMAKDRRDRYATIGAFAEAFARAVGVSMVKARQPGAALESSMDRPGPAGPVSIPRAAEKPRFTMPDPISAAALGSPPEKRSRAALWLAVFAVAIVVVACVSAGLALGLREISFP